MHRRPLQRQPAPDPGLPLPQAFHQHAAERAPAPRGWQLLEHVNLCLLGWLVRPRRGHAHSLADGLHVPAGLQLLQRGLDLYAMLVLGAQRQSQVHHGPHLRVLHQHRALPRRQRRLLEAPQQVDPDLVDADRVPVVEHGPQVVGARADHVLDRQVPEPQRQHRRACALGRVLAHEDVRRRNVQVQPHAHPNLR
eukprot:1713675-Rhodomonas_salina.1